MMKLTDKGLTETARMTEGFSFAYMKCCNLRK
jgi:hypothetical protein